MTKSTECKKFIKKNVLASLISKMVNQRNLIANALFFQGLFPIFFFNTINNEQYQNYYT